MSQIEHAPERRSRRLVDKPFQFALMRLLGTMWLINMVVLGGLIYYLYVGPVFRVDHLAGQANLESVNSSPPQFGVLLTLGAVLGLALVVTIGLHMSHQVAGPLAQVKSKLRAVASGDLSSELRFRAGDYLGDLPEHFNDMTRSLRERGRHEIEALHEIEMMLEPGSSARTRLAEFLADKKASIVEPAASASPEETSDSRRESDPVHAH